MESPLDVAARTKVGREARHRVPRSTHADWKPAPDRRDPVELLAEQNLSRLQWLVPIRHARMAASPFAFYRGTARIMAGDLGSTATRGVDVQLGGDAHLANFGAYASPERQLVFDANDFDETLRGPWEWDLKRLAASFMIAGQHVGLSAGDNRKVTATMVRAYREAMTGYADQGYLTIWYDHMTHDKIRESVGLDNEAFAANLDRFERRAQKKTSLQALGKLAERVDGHYRIRSD